jgi:hypothetical protein
MKYEGETKRIIKFRFVEHRGFVNNNDDNIPEPDLCLYYIKFREDFLPIPTYGEIQFRAFTVQNPVNFT